MDLTTLAQTKQSSENTCLFCAERRTGECASAHHTVYTPKTILTISNVLTFENVPCSFWSKLFFGPHSPVCFQYKNTHTDVPVLLTAYCQNKQHHSCQHRNLCERRRDSDTHLAPALSHCTNIWQREMCRETCSRVKRISGVFILQTHTHACAIPPLCRTHSTSDRNTDCH